MHPRIQLALWAAMEHSWLRFHLLSARTCRPHSATSHPTVCTYIYPGLSCPRSRIWHLLLLNFMWLVIAQPSVSISLLSLCALKKFLPSLLLLHAVLPVCRVVPNLAGNAWDLQVCILISWKVQLCPLWNVVWSFLIADWLAWLMMLASFQYPFLFFWRVCVSVCVVYSLPFFHPCRQGP